MRWLRTLGIVLTIIGVLGFLTVADDLRHVGEFIAVAGIFLSGLLFLAASSAKGYVRLISMNFAVAIIIGTLVWVCIR
jgi:hypothetical protein